MTTDTQPAKAPKLTPTGDLLCELIAARHRLGHHRWTIDSRHGPTLKSLHEAGLVKYFDGIVEHTYLAELTDEGRRLYLSDTYVPPITLAIKAQACREAANEAHLYLQPTVAVEVRGWLSRRAFEMEEPS